MSLIPNLKKSNPRENVVFSQQFDKEFLFELFDRTDFMKDNKYEVSNILNNRIVAMLFYEPSTRTRFSFESAVHRLGGKVIGTENASVFSSAKKGETLEDTINMVSGYSDIIVLRHNEDDSSERAVFASDVPIINAGSGSAQHPTQALLDVYTIYDEFGRLEDLRVGLVGDLLRGRTCDSLVYLLSKFDNNQFYFVSPENSKVKPSLKSHLDENNVSYFESGDLNDLLPNVDVCYMTRIQKERFSSDSEYELAKGKFILDTDNVNTMKKDAIVMHPLPRVDEITTAVDLNPRARYKQQAKNGLYVRMALLEMIAKNLN